MSSPGGMELALVFCVGVTVNSNDANRRAGCVRDDDWLRQHGAGGGWSHAAAADVWCSGYTPRIQENKYKHVLSIAPLKTKVTSASTETRL